MSGTSFGTVKLHVAPEAAMGSTLALVQNGDLIAINITAKSITLVVSDVELQQRKQQLKPFATPHKRGHTSLCIREVLQANECFHFDFLKPKNADELIL